MLKQLFDDREAWLTEAAGLMLDDLITPQVQAAGYDYERPPVRISVGFPKHTRGGKAIAVCFIREASTDGHNEIFISPEEDDPIRVMMHLAHELIHAYDDCASGHRNFFARIARAIGLEGKFTATYAGEALIQTLEEYRELLGAFPHQKMITGKGHKKGGTRQIKVECSNCGFVFRASRKQLDRVPMLAEGEGHCPVCDGATLGEV